MLNAVDQVRAKALQDYRLKLLQYTENESKLKGRKLSNFLQTFCGNTFSVFMCLRSSGNIEGAYESV